MRTTDVRFWEPRQHADRASRSYEARWVVAGKVKSRSRRTKPLADAFLSDLRQAARRGEYFDVETGLPESMLPAAAGATWLDLARRYVDAKWPHAAAKSRDSVTDALATITPAFSRRATESPDATVLRTALRRYVLPPAGRLQDPPAAIEEAIAWLEAESVAIEALTDRRLLRKALQALSVTMAGTPAAATTARRKRAVLHNALEFAVEQGDLSANLLGTVGWRPPKVADLVDRRVVVNPAQARELITAVSYVGALDRGRHMMTLIAVLYFAGLRPSEAIGLTLTDCDLPRQGWGYLTVSRSRPQTNRRWTDTGESHDSRGLKHRPANDSRRVPIPPELVVMLNQHLAEFGTAVDGRIFHTRRGGLLTKAYSDAFAAARTLALKPEQVASPLADRPYSMRHAAVSLWLNAGVPATEVAERAGHGVEVLLRVYAKCIDGGEQASNHRIDAVLADGNDV